MAETGVKSLESVRRVEIDDALVDTGAMILSLPTRVIQQLGLRITGQKRTITTGGPRMANVYQAVRLTVQDRDCTVDVWEVPDSVPLLHWTNTVGDSGLCRGFAEAEIDW